MLCTETASGRSCHEKYLFEKRENENDKDPKCKLCDRTKHDCKKFQKIDIAEYDDGNYFENDEPEVYVYICDICDSAINNNKLWRRNRDKQIIVFNDDE